MRFLTSETRRLRDYLKLTRLIDDVEPGFYIYLRREGAWLVLCRAGLDEMDELCATDKTARVHLPYLFEEKIEGPTHPRRDLIDEIKWITENHFAFVDVLLEADRADLLGAGRGLYRRGRMGEEKEGSD